MIKNIIFDFDGTIADDLQIMLEQFNRMAHEFGLPEIKEEEVEKFRGQALKDILSNVRLSKIRILLLIRRLQAEFKNTISECKPVDGLPQVLKSLKKKGYVLGVISSNTKDNITKFMEHHNLNQFDFVHCGRDIFGKSHVIKRVLKEYKLNPANSIYVGDEDRDIAAAHGAGIPVISVTWGFNNEKLLAKHKPDKIARKPIDLLKLV